MIGAMRGQFVGSLALTVALAACAGGSSTPDAAPCGAGELSCGSACVDPMIEHDHCGSCDVACSAEQECRAGQCEVPCRMMLSSPVTDDWGTDWDGVERTAATVGEASVACAGFSGRLPSVAELYRVRTGANGIATAAEVNPLWSSTPNGRDDQITVSLADGAITATPAATPITYRCVCAASEPAYFGGARCNGPPGSNCYPVGRQNVDSRDRPALRKSAAIWECAGEHAHLADVATLVEALQKGVLGSGAFLHTADQSRYDLSTTMAWTTATWPAAGNVSYVDDGTPAPFRCAGWSFATGTHPNPVPGEFVGAGGGYKGEAADTAAAGWAAAHDACVARGGHLPRSAELAELIMAGLPSGSATALWSSDEVGYNGTDFLAAVLAWSTVDPRYPYDYAPSGTITWAYKTASNLFRCIYYPIDPGYVPPTTCEGGCFTLTLPGATPGVIWFDSLARPAALMEAAIDTCRREGGHLPSERDYTEAIRAGLPNGISPEWHLTSDIAMTNVHVVRWTGVEPTFTDLYSTHMTWAGPTAPYPFRCMWTNELR